MKNKSCELEWTYHHDREVGVQDYPADPKIRIIDYWTRDDGVRIGLFGRGKGIIYLTYRHGSINFRLSINRTFENNFYDEDRDYEGPYCKLWIDGDLAPQIELEYLDRMIEAIKSFLLIYRDPRYPHEPLIEYVTVPLYHLYKAELERVNGKR